MGISYYWSPFVKRLLQNCNRQFKQSLELKILVKKKGVKLKVKWEGYDTCLNK